MKISNDKTKYNLHAVVFAFSLMLSVLIPLILPRLLAKPGQGAYNPEWVPMLGLFFGMIAIITVPFAWRWFRRQYTKGPP